MIISLLWFRVNGPLSPPSKPMRFQQYTSTRLLAQFDEDLQNIQKISMRISTGNVIGPRYKIRLLRVRFTPLERPERSEGNDAYWARLCCYFTFQDFNLMFLFNSA